MHDFNSIPISLDPYGLKTYKTQSEIRFLSYSDLASKLCGRFFSLRPFFDLFLAVWEPWDIWSFQYNLKWVLDTQLQQLQVFKTLPIAQDRRNRRCSHSDSRKLGKSVSMNPRGQKRGPFFVFILRHEGMGLTMGYLYVLEAERSGDYDGVKKTAKFVACGRHRAPKDILHFHGAPGRLLSW